MVWLRYLIWLSAAGPALAAPAPPDTLRPLSPVRELTYAYANDLFFRTDYYFTQGMRLTLQHPALAQLPTRHLLAAGPVGSTQQFGIALRYDGFTPLRIQDAFIRVGDRPYAAYLYASFFRTVTTPVRQLTTALEIGFIGPAAGGRELQTFLHRITGNAAPRGWQYQVGNAPVLAYRARLARRLAAAPGRAELTGHAEAVLGTLYTHATAGLNLRAGHFASNFQLPATAGRSRWQLAGQAGLAARAVGYNATLQGNLFGAKDPYTLASRDVARVVWRSTGGLVLAHGNLRLAATATWISPEFAGGRAHRWGELALTVGL